MAGLLGNRGPVQNTGALTSYRGGPTPTSVQEAEANAAEQNHNFYSDVPAGFVSGIRGTVGSTKAYVASALDAAGHHNAAKNMYQSAAEDAAVAQNVAPEVASLEQVHGVGDFGRWAAGKVGGGLSAIPVAMAGGLAGRALLGGAGGAAIGAGASFQPSMAGAHIQALNNDPATAGLSPQEKFARGSLVGTGEAALMGLAPGAMAERVFTRAPVATTLRGAALNTAGEALKHSAGMGVASAGANAVDQAAMIQAGSQKPFDIGQVGEEGLGGAVGMLPMAAPHALGAHVGDYLAAGGRAGADAAKRAGKFTADAAVAGAKASAPLADRAMGAGSDAVDNLKRAFSPSADFYMQHPELAELSKPQSIPPEVANGADADVLAWGEQDNARRNTLAKTQAERVLADANASGFDKHAAKSVLESADPYAWEKYSAGVHARQGTENVAAALGQAGAEMRGWMERMKDRGGEAFQTFKDNTDLMGGDGTKYNKERTAEQKAQDDEYYSVMAEPVARAGGGDPDVALFGASALRSFVLGRFGDVDGNGVVDVPHGLLKTYGDNLPALTARAYDALRRQGLTKSMDADAAVLLKEVNAVVKERKAVHTTAEAAVRDGLTLKAQKHMPEHMIRHVSGEISNYLEKHYGRDKSGAGRAHDEAFEQHMEDMFGPSKEAVLNNLRLLHEQHRMSAKYGNEATTKNVVGEDRAGNSDDHAYGETDHEAPLFEQSPKSRYHAHETKGNAPRAYDVTDRYDAQAIDRKLQSLNPAEYESKHDHQLNKSVVKADSVGVVDHANETGDNQYLTSLLDKHPDLSYAQINERYKVLRTTERTPEDNEPVDVKPAELAEPLTNKGRENKASWGDVTTLKQKQADGSFKNVPVDTIAHGRVFLTRASKDYAVSAGDESMQFATSAQKLINKMMERRGMGAFDERTMDMTGVQQKLSLFAAGLTSLLHAGEDFKYSDDPRMHNTEARRAERVHAFTGDMQVKMPDGKMKTVTSVDGFPDNFVLYDFGGGKKLTLGEAREQARAEAGVHKTGPTPTDKEGNAKPYKASKRATEKTELGDIPDMTRGELHTAWAAENDKVLLNEYAKKREELTSPRAGVAKMAAARMKAIAEHFGKDDAWRLKKAEVKTTEEMAGTVARMEAFASAHNDRVGGVESVSTPLTGAVKEHYNSERLRQNMREVEHSGPHRSVAYREATGSRDKKTAGPVGQAEWGTGRKSEHHGIGESEEMAALKAAEHDNKVHDFESSFDGLRVNDTTVPLKERSLENAAVARVKDLKARGQMLDRRIESMRSEGVNEQRIAVGEARREVLLTEYNKELDKWRALKDKRVAIEEAAAARKSEADNQMSAAVGARALDARSTYPELAQVKGVKPEAPKPTFAEQVAANKATREAKMARRAAEVAEFRAKKDAEAKAGVEFTRALAEESADYLREMRFDLQERLSDGSATTPEMSDQLAAVEKAIAERFPRPTLRERIAAKKDDTKFDPAKLEHALLKEDYTSLETPEQVMDFAKQVRAEHKRLDALDEADQLESGKDVQLSQATYGLVSDAKGYLRGAAGMDYASFFDGMPGDHDALGRQMAEILVGRKPTSPEPGTKFNKESAAPEGEATKHDASTSEGQKALAAELFKRVGKGVKLVFSDAKSIDGSASWKNNAETHKSVIRLAMNAVDPLSKLHHESMHEFFHRLIEGGRSNAQETLLKAANGEWVRRQLELTFQHEPEVLKQLANDPAERVAYMYQLWTADKIKVGPQTETIFTKVLNTLRKVFGQLSADQQAVEMMKQFYDGAMADRDAMARVLDTNEARGAYLRKTAMITKPLLSHGAEWVGFANNALIGSKNVHLDWIGNELYNKVGVQGKKQGLLSAKEQAEAQLQNMAADALRGLSKQEVDMVLESSQKGTWSSDPKLLAAEQKMQAFFKHAFEYAGEAGVKTWNAAANEGKGAWEPMQAIKDYRMPVSWDASKLVQDGARFKALLLEHHADELAHIAAESNNEVAEGRTAGDYTASWERLNNPEKKGETAAITPEDIAEAIMSRMVRTNGQVALKESANSLGFSPHMQAVNKRSLHWIDQKVFHEFQEKDPAKIITTYIGQLAHRAEYSRRFGADGKILQDRMEKAWHADIDAMMEKAGVKDAVKTAMDNAEQSAKDGYDTTWQEELGYLLGKEDYKDAEEAGEAITQLSMMNLDSARKSIMAQEGTLGNDISPLLRRVNAYSIVYQNVRLLGYPLLSSLIDPLGIMVNGGEFKDAYSTLKRGLTAVVKDWGELTGLREKKESDRDDITKLSEMIGTTDSGMFMSTLGQTYGSQYLGEKARNLNDKFFRWNGMESFNKAMREGATQAAIHAIKRHIEKPSEHSERFFKEYGLDVGGYDLKELSAAFTKHRGDAHATSAIAAAENHTRKVTRGGLSASELRTLARIGVKPSGGKHLIGADGRLNVENRNVQQAVMRWVDGAILRPNAAIRPTMSSDPHYATFYHLKGFMYATQAVILRRVQTEIKNGNSDPLMMLFAGYIPVMLAADAAKGVLQELAGGGAPTWEHGSAGEVLEHGVERAGLPGVGQLGIDALRYGPTSLLGPNVEQFTRAMTQPVHQTFTDAIMAGPLSIANHGGSGGQTNVID